MARVEENLADVLAQRASELGAPIQICDALSPNLPQNFEVLAANCVAHGRRKMRRDRGELPG